MAINLDTSQAGAVTLKAPTTGTVTLTLPQTPGSSGYVMSTDGSGILSFIPPNSGSTGLTGATGATGNIGATGSTGATGYQGATGATGYQGATGATGPIGATGSAGSQGTVGGTGATGATGQQGSTGASGYTGATGATGATGYTGATGATGSQGATGAAGGQGSIGSTGATGLGYANVTSTTPNSIAKGTLSFTVNQQGAFQTGGRVRAIYNTTNYVEGVVTITGGTSWSIAVDNAVGGVTNVQPWTMHVAGDIGSTGATGLTGSTGFNGATGATGQGATGNVGATGATGYTGTTGATGQQGPQGATGGYGSTGAQGNIGATGATGQFGATGATGLQGATGGQGTNGNNGATGATGATGLPGATGSNGVNGVTGATGYTGSTGATGATGYTGATGAAGTVYSSYYTGGVLSAGSYSYPGSPPGTSYSTAGWYTIATNSGDRANARFVITDTTSGLHQEVVFYASVNFGQPAAINVVANSFYSGNVFAYLRIIQGSTYDGAALQVFIGSQSNYPTVYMYDNQQSSGWILKNWIPSSTNPGNINGSSTPYTGFYESTRAYLGYDRQGLTQAPRGLALGFDSTPRLLPGNSVLGAQSSGNTQGTQLRVQTDYAYADLGAVNTTWFHHYTNANNGFYWYQFGQNASSWRAPYFYDSDNTGYYIKASGTTNLYYANINAGLFVNNYVYFSTNNINTINVGYNSASSGQDLWFNYRGYQDGFSYYRNFNIGNGQGGNIAWFNGANNYVAINNGQSASYTLHVNGTIYGSSDVRAPVFYYSGNTAYYFAPNNASGTTLSTAYSTDAFGYNPSYGTYMGGTNARYIYNGNSSYTGPVWYNSGGIYTIIHSGNITNYTVGTAGGTFTGAIYAPIFYDYNNAAYYCDPNGTSVLTQINMYGTLYTNNPMNYASSAVTSLTNAPISTTNWDPNVGTTGQFVPLTNQTALYNSGYRTHVNTGIYKDASGWSAGWYMAIGGNDSYPTEWFQLRYGGYITHSYGYVSIGGSVRSPVWYDTDNTGYYIDGNNTSNLYAFVSYSLQGNGNVGGTGSASWHPSGIYSAGYNWLYGGMNLGGGDVSNGGSAYFTIMYDNNNSGYYSDPNGTSRLSTIYCGDVYNDLGGWFRNYGVTGLYNQTYGIHWYADNNLYWNATSSGGSGALILRNGYESTVKGYFYWDGSGSGLLNDQGGWSVRNNYGGGYGGTLYGSWISTGDHRAPVFYDYNDTTYYADLNNTTYLKYLKVNTDGSSSGSRSLTIKAAGTGEINFGSYPGPWTSALQIQDNSASQFMWLSPLSSQGYGWIYHNTYPIFFYGSGGFAGGAYSGSLRSSVFYDYDNTTYYIDANNKSLMYTFGGGMQAANGMAGYGSGNWANDFYNTPPSSFTFGQDTYQGGPTGTWWFQENMRHTNGSNYWGRQLAWGWEDNAHELYTRNISANNFTGWVRFLNSNNYNGYSYFTGAVYGTIYYDYNNTGYYADPNGSSQFNRIYDNNYIVMQGQTGIMGDYNASGTATKCIWTIGESWPLGNMYGLAYEYSSSSYIGTDHTIAIKENGGTYNRIHMGGGAWFGGTLSASSNLYTPIYYDWNSTGYYCDPNSQSQLSYVMADNWFRPQGGTGLYHNSYGHGLWAPESQGNSYGNWTTYGGGRNGWQGWGIASQWHMMGRDGTDLGFYDQSWGWLIYWTYNTGNAMFGTSGNSGYRIYASGSIYATGNVYAASDRRIKKNIVTIDNALNKVLRLRGVYYEKIKDIDAENPQLRVNPRQLGMIAQEVDEVVPELVTYDSTTDEFGLNYAPTVGLLVEAIKEQNATIVKQQSEIDELKELVEKLLNGATKNN
jgi:Chaperone of endosialidase/Collagen triple helix repeat (20 copies)